MIDIINPVTDDGDIMVTKFNPDSNVLQVSRIFGPEGGTILVRQADSPISGVKVDIPEGALGEMDTVSLGYNTSEIKIRAGTGSEVIIVLRCGQTTGFNMPVSIDVPFDPTVNPDLVIPYQVDGNGGLHVMEIGDIDTENNILNVLSFRPCMFTLVYP